MLFAIFFILVAVVLLCWLVSIAPIPASMPAAAIRWIAYALIVIIALYMLARTAGVHLP